MVKFNNTLLAGEQQGTEAPSIQQPQQQAEEDLPSQAARLRNRIVNEILNLYCPNGHVFFD